MIDSQFLLKVFTAAFATVGIEEFIKNFLKTKKTWVYALLMIPLSIGSYFSVEVLPMWVIGFVCLWQYAGQSMMLYMAQISGISKSIYEASYIDGCTKTKSFRYITIPLIKPMVGTAVSLNAIGSLKFFDLIFNMTEGGPNHRTEVLATHLYLQGFKHNKYGYASTIGVILLALCLITTGVINKFFKTENYEM